MSRRGLIDIAIVGAGVVGAAAALALARDGWQVILIEAREPPRWRVEHPDLRVYAFAPDNAALLDDLGVWRSIADARLQPYRAMRVWDAAGGDELRFDADGFGRRELGWIVENGLLVDRLWSALPGAGVKVLCPASLSTLEQGEEYATLELEDGTRLRARLVLAADGGDSKLRTLAGIETYTHDYGQNGLVAFVEHGLPHEATCWQRFLPAGPLAFLPFAAEAGHCSSIVWTLPEAEALRLQDCDKTAFLRELENAFAGTLGALTAVSKRVSFPLKRQLAQTHVAGRVAVIGDAAHVVHPLAGQGVNLGLRDVSALRTMLQCQHVLGRDPGGATPLARWARERRSENAMAAYSFDSLNRLFSNDNLFATLARGPLLALAGKLPPLRHALWKRAAGQ
jgi:2-octaprenyl-3-methyl-6-methoxy-1,4-benzoquinol hydroxylase